MLGELSPPCQELEEAGIDICVDKREAGEKWSEANEVEWRRRVTRATAVTAAGGPSHGSLECSLSSQFLCNLRQTL